MNYLQPTLPKTSIKFWTNYLVQMRPYLFFVSGVVGFAGMAITDSFELLTLPAILSFIALFFSYGFGQAFTDCYQTDTDRISAPYRPLSKGVVSIYDVKTVSLIGLVAVTITLCVFNFINLFVCIIAVIGTYTYTYVKRNLWFAGPGYNAFILMLIMLLGYLAIADLPLEKLITPTIIKLAALTFVSYSNFVLIGYLKDISADKETGYKTFPVIFGWDKTVWLGDIVLLLSSIIYFSIILDNLMGIIIGIIAVLVGLSGQISAHLAKEKVEKNSSFAIVSTVRCILLWHLGVVISYNSNLIIFASCFYLIFELIMYLRPMKEQI
jgi:4-hydroxybenzoate polyprenyltransferase